LPDICGWIKDPGKGSKARCIEFFDEYLKSKYTREATENMEEHVFLTGSDFYALRCAFLHEGRDDILKQRARQVLDRFQFVVAQEGWVVHCNQSDQLLQLQVDIFCREVSEAASKFVKDANNSPRVIKPLGSNAAASRCEWRSNLMHEDIYTDVRVMP